LTSIETPSLFLYISLQRIVEDICFLVCHYGVKNSHEWMILMCNFLLAGSKRPKRGHIGRGFSRASTSHPQPQTFMLQSSTVTYGGPNGACYTSSTTRRAGGDGVCAFLELSSLLYL
jgi:hypothetical protein